MNIKINFIIFCLFTVSWCSLISCQECDDCGPLRREPIVNLRFINQDSLTAIEGTIATQTELISQLNDSLIVLAGTISFFEDSITQIDLQIANDVVGLDDLRVEIQATIDTLQSNSNSLQELIAEEQTNLTSLSGTESDILAGRVFIDSIVSVIDMTSGDFGTDSLELFAFPLSVNRDSVSYNIYLGGDVYDLSLSYDRMFQEDERSRIEVQVSNVQITNSSFREEQINCDVCLSNETTITAYF